MATDGTGTGRGALGGAGIGRCDVPGAEGTGRSV